MLLPLSGSAPSIVSTINTTGCEARRREMATAVLMNKHSYLAGDDGSITQRVATEQLILLACEFHELYMYLLTSSEQTYQPTQRSWNNSLTNNC